MGFSVFPYIGWIFDIFMIFRALLEHRWIYAILMIMNWYQWLFWKMISFGLLSIDLGPILKMFYLGPYAAKRFGLTTVSASFLNFISKLSGEMPQVIKVISPSGD